MWWWFLGLLLEDPQAQAARVRSQMQAAIAAQRESVKKQAAVAHPTMPRPSRVLASVPSGASAQEFTLALPPQPSILAMAASAMPFAQAVFAQPGCDPLPQPEIASLVDFAAQENNLNPLLIREVARQESGFRPCALSSQGAMGLMQLMPDTQMQLGVANPWDPRESIEAGSRLLRQLLDRYHGDVSLALGAYNAGPGRVDQTGGIPRIPETQNYVDSILYRLLPNGDGTAFAPGPGLAAPSALLAGP